MIDTMANPDSFLGQHFIRWMDAWKDGRLVRIRVEDLSFEPQREHEACVVYCIANDLDTEWQEPLLTMWRELRSHTPPPVPSNIILGAN
jgi:hypothetical protein